MNTFSKMWNITTPEEAQHIINNQKSIISKNPTNLEEQAISLVGIDIYRKLIKGYTEKQWGRDCKDLPTSIIKRLPVRYTYNNNYFNARYQGIPIGGYNLLINKLLKNVEVKLNTDFHSYYNESGPNFKKIIYTGTIDSYFNYKLGILDYRSLKFRTFKLQQKNYQGVAVMNFTAKEIPYTRIIEHKHFEFGTQPITYITKEYPSNWKIGDEAYYPINNEKNLSLYKKYVELAKRENNVIFGGRLGEYKYYDMDQIIDSALKLVNKELI